MSKLSPRWSTLAAVTAVTAWRAVATLLLVLAAGCERADAPRSTPQTATVARPQAELAPGNIDDAPDLAALHQAIAERAHDRWLQGRAKVRKTLPDDNDGSRHQRFLLDVGAGRTVLVAHNIDLAPRAPVHAGALVGFRGAFVHNDKGGVLHWTHRDPGGRRAGGWLEVGGRRYE